MRRRGIRWGRWEEVLLLVAVAVTLGASRAFVFINLNYQIDHLARHTRFSYAHSLVQGWTRGMDLGALHALKWAMAMVFTAVMAGLCILLARILLGTWKYAVPIAAGFAFFALLSVVMHMLSAWVPPLELVSVELSHMLQYPVTLLFVFVASTLAPGKAEQA